MACYTVQTHRGGDISSVVDLRELQGRVGQQQGLHNHEVAPGGLGIPALDLHLANDLRAKPCKLHAQLVMLKE